MSGQRPSIFVLVALLVLAGMGIGALVELRAVRGEIAQMKDDLVHAIHHKSVLAHFEQRRAAIAGDLARSRDPIVIVGDSVTEAAPLPAEICGHSIVNAGVSGASMADYVPALRPLFGASRPRLGIIALGANRPATIEATLPLLLAEAGHAFADVALVAVAGERPEIAEANALLARSGLPMIRPTILADGFIDGLHPNATGYRHWISAIEAHIRASGVCVG